MSSSGISSTNNNTGLLSEQLLNESSGLGSGSTLTNSGSGSTTQIVGLASGINTTELIQAELAEQELPLENVQNEITALNTENSSLSSIQNALQAVSVDALALGEPSTYFPVQNVASSNTNAVTAATSNGVGAVIGATTITVTALASASQSDFTYAAGTGTGQNTLSITVGSGAAKTLSVADNATADDIAEAVNNAGNLGVWATVNTAGQLVLSSQSTGTGQIVSASLTNGSGGSATLTTGTQQDGGDATFYLNGSTTASTSPTDTVANAIPGVTLTLDAVTGDTPTTNPVTITTSAPGPDTTTITQAVQQFVTDYNNAMSLINQNINTAPASESTPSDYSPYSGSLFGDDELENLFGDVRTAMYQNYSGSGIATGMTSLDQIGISTGTSTGEISNSSVAGQLTLNTSDLAAALKSNPNGVQALLQTWSTNLQKVVNDAASPIGSIETRIGGNDTLITSLGNQLTTQEALFNTQESQMEQQWASVESTLENLDNQKTSLSSFASGLSSSSSGG